MKRRLNAKFLGTVSGTLVLLPVVFLIMAEAAYQIAERLRTRPSAIKAVYVDPRVAEAIWISQSDHPPYALEPVWPWNVLARIYLVKAGKHLQEVPYRKGETVASACTRLRLGEQKIGKSSPGYRFKGLVDVMWLSRNSSPELVTSCVAEKSVFWCGIRGYSRAADELLGKNMVDLTANDILTLSSMAYFGPESEGLRKMLTTRRNEMADAYVRNGLLKQPEADELKKAPLPDIKPCPAAEPPRN